MKISITISDLGLVDSAVLATFLSDLENNPAVAVRSVPSGPIETVIAAPKLEPTDGKPKRKRRTKAEMAEAKAAEEDQGAPEPEQPTIRRRRASPESEAEPTSRRRRTPAPEDLALGAEDTTEAVPSSASTDEIDEIDDDDVAKAASAAAEILTPDVVMALLEEFSVTNVGMLDQDARRDFISILDQKVDDFLPND